MGVYVDKTGVSHLGLFAPRERTVVEGGGMAVFARGRPTARGAGCSCVTAAELVIFFASLLRPACFSTSSRMF